MIITIKPLALSNYSKPPTSMFCLIVELSIYGKLVRSCWDGLSVVLTTLFVDRLTLSGFKSSTQFTSFHQYSAMLSSERMDVKNNS